MLDMQEQMKQIMSALNNKVDNKEIEKIKESKYIEPDDYVEIHPNKRIKVISLYDGVLTLTTGDGGQGKPYIFRHFGDAHNITYSDLSEILHYHFSFAQKGYFYICDKDVIYNHNLTDVYNQIMNKETIDNLLDMDQKEMIDLFNYTNDFQREVIVSMISLKLAKNEELDLNKVDAIERAYSIKTGTKFKFSESILTEEDLKVS